MPTRATTSKSRTSTKSAKTAPANSRTVKAPAKKKTNPKKSAADSAAVKEVTIDRRRGKRRGEEAASEPTAAPARPKLERRQKVNRRRQIDPTTCERDYSDEEIEFMSALDEYKRANGRMFPTCSEVLEVIRGLGYVKLASAESSSLVTRQSPQAPLSELTEEDEFGAEMTAMATAGEES